MTRSIADLLKSLEGRRMIDANGQQYTMGAVHVNQRLLSAKYDDGTVIRSLFSCLNDRIAPPEPRQPENNDWAYAFG